MKSKPRVHWLGWAVVLLAVVEGGWLAFDGGRAPRRRGTICYRPW